MPRQPTKMATTTGLVAQANARTATREVHGRNEDVLQGPHDRPRHRGGGVSRMARGSCRQEERVAHRPRVREPGQPHRRGDPRDRGEASQVRAHPSLRPHRADERQSPHYRCLVGQAAAGRLRRGTLLRRLPQREGRLLPGIERQGQGRYLHHAHHPQMGDRGGSALLCQNGRSEVLPLDRARHRSRNLPQVRRVG